MLWCSQENIKSQKNLLKRSSRVESSLRCRRRRLRRRHPLYRHPVYTFKSTLHNKIT